MRLWSSFRRSACSGTVSHKKFIYGLLREGARAKDYEIAIMWLSDCGLIHKVSRVNTIGIPLKAYEDLKAFKLFVLDVGLLSCMTVLSQQRCWMGISCSSIMETESSRGR